MKRKVTAEHLFDMDLSGCAFETLGPNPYWGFLTPRHPIKDDPCEEAVRLTFNIGGSPGENQMDVPLDELVHLTRAD